MKKFFTSEETARLADCSLRQLQWWDEKGIICPDCVRSRPGGPFNTRSYTFEQVLRASVLQDLRRRARSLQDLRIITFVDARLPFLAFGKGRSHQCRDLTELVLWPRCGPWHIVDVSAHKKRIVQHAAPSESNPQL